MINGERYNNYNSEYLYKGVDLSLSIKDYDESRREIIWMTRKNQLHLGEVSELDMIRV